ncbi:hypothetical protein C6P46_003183 [Rhodotorula mucilaginosa]|uniref:Uncharacterized protein n=1 Tax=Rhodotorula mucilaginosa TaxID=5537 RepID=A0A9P7B6I1_RHOMI|nr:hypothetical protein C6P46_003183 [Rhodotorula mucilaginosa]
MPRRTSHEAEPPACAHRDSHWLTPDPRTDPNLKIEDCPEFVTVEGVKSRSLHSLSRHIRGIKFTGFVGINLLRRYCNRAGHLSSSASEALTKIGLPGRISQETKKVVPRQDLECSLTWQSLHAVVNRRIKTGVETFPPDDPARIQYDEYYQEVVYRRAVAEVPPPFEGHSPSVIPAEVQVPSLGSFQAGTIEVKTYAPEVLLMHALSRLIDAEQILRSVDSHSASRNSRHRWQHAHEAWAHAMLELVLLYDMHIAAQNAIEEDRNAPISPGDRAEARARSQRKRRLELGADLSESAEAVFDVSSRLFLDVYDFLRHTPPSRVAQDLVHFIRTTCKIEDAPPGDQDRWLLSIAHLAGEVLLFLKDKRSLSVTVATTFKIVNGATTLADTGVTVELSAMKKSGMQEGNSGMFGDEARAPEQSSKC